MAETKRRPYKKIALVLSLCAILLWMLMGTGASLAWFSDTSDEVKNIFHAAKFELAVSHRLENGDYEQLDGDTKVFDDEAIYEPGYTQVVYLKIENRGTLPFDLKTAVSVSEYTAATNVFGQSFDLQDYLTFGFVTAKDEAEVMAAVATRADAALLADTPLCNYEKELTPLAAGETLYMALVVRMPENVGNEANYRGEVVPRVALGLIFDADQQR